MNRRPRIPGTRSGRALYVLPSIPDDLPEEVKDGLAIRNAASIEGRCPSCGARGEIEADDVHDRIFHLVFRHEPWCQALLDEAVA